MTHSALRGKATVLVIIALTVAVLIAVVLITVVLLDHFLRTELLTFNGG